MNMHGRINQKGQTIIEAVLAIGIITIALVGLLSRSGTNLISSRDANYRVVAGNLSREGVEAVRNIRDSNWLKGCLDPNSTDVDVCRHWNDGIFDTTTFNSSEKYNIATVEFPVADEISLAYLNENYTFNDCLNDSLCRLYINQSGHYTHEDFENEETMFYRLISVYPICDLDGQLCSTPDSSSMIGVKVVSSVKWPYKDIYHEVALEEYLYNWK